MKAYSVVIVVVVVFFSYIDVTSEFMRTVNCVEVDDVAEHKYDVYATAIGNRVWAEDTSLTCFERAHKTTGVLGILGLVMFSLCTILFIATWLSLNADMLNDPTFVAEFGFIYQGYREKKQVTYWEVVITSGKPWCLQLWSSGSLWDRIFRESRLGSAPTGTGRSVYIPVLSRVQRSPQCACLLWKVVYENQDERSVQEMVGYHNIILLNGLEEMSLMASIFVFYAGVLFNDDNASNAGKYVIAAFTFTVNFGFVVYVLYRLYSGDMCL